MTHRTPVLETLSKKLREDAEAAAQFLSGGGAKSLEEYREVVGRIRGLRLAQQAIKDLSQSLLEDNDDE